MLLSPQQFQQVSGAIRDLTPTQLAWVSGYLSGLTNPSVVVPAMAAANASLPGVKTTVLYGSQTGNSKRVAEQLYARLQESHPNVVLQDIKSYRPQNLKQEQRLFVVISTHGNGEPPDDARAFFQFVQSERAPKLDMLQYAVLALGDASYEAFCETGVALDQRLAALGATRLLPRVDCDVDFKAAAGTWQQAVVDATCTHTSEQPYQAEVLSNTVLTDAGSTKEVFHLALSLEDSGIQYQPGDILAVSVPNAPELVEQVLRLSGLAADEVVVLQGQELPLYQVLQEHRELSSVTRRQWQAYAPPLAQMVAADWLDAADWVDVLQAFPSQLPAQAFVDVLRPLQPRQYSIASSPTAHADEVHLLIKRVVYDFQGRTHLGVASNGLAQVTAGMRVAVSVKENPHFKLPEEPQTPVIMIGAGTGVAPFRSFLFEREAQGIRGKTWLFFGEQRFRSDFLYQAEWLQLMENGTLERMNVAFSRDQAQKQYVQHRLRESAVEVYQWLTAGAHVYVCGDMHGMAKDVHQALLAIVQEQGGYTEADASALLEQWIAQRRYQRDVY
jgi:sulfite reductase (NADPH) flavoprotein alpha-component